MLTRKFIADAINQNFWDFSNRILYDLCASYPEHTNDDVIAAKVVLIGRVYAAAIERGCLGAETTNGDSFYEKTVAQRIRESGVDTWLKELSNDLNVEISLKIHKKVMTLFKEISGLEKRSLASKYLHFHFPAHFYIFDSRAQESIVALTRSVGRHLPKLDNYDDVYARFFLRCQALNGEIQKIFGRLLTPRELDKVLLAWEQT